MIGILHSPVYTFFEKACIIELNADVETGNSKFEISSKNYGNQPLSAFGFRLSALMQRRRLGFFSGIS